MLFSVWFLTFAACVFIAKGFSFGTKKQMQDDLERQKFLSDPEGYQPPNLTSNLEREEIIFHNLQCQILCNAIVARYTSPNSHRFSWKGEYTKRCTKAGIKKILHEPTDSWAPDRDTFLWKSMYAKMIRIQSMEGYEAFETGEITSTEFEKMQGTKMEFM